MRRKYVLKNLDIMTLSINNLKVKGDFRMKLIIVESPTKTHTISQILGPDYLVEASLGHIRDLATTGKGGLGVDLENNFKPTYVISENKRDIVQKLRSLKNKVDEVILATDPDREGEAISWHIAEVLNLPINKTKRLEFHEVTKNAILKAIENPRLIDLNLVASQETRRIIDRIIGFKLSTLLKSKIKSRSAGRVQSVTLRFIVDREREIQKFVPEEYWTIQGLFNNKCIDATLKGYKIENKEIKFVEKEIQTSDEKEDVTKIKIKNQKEVNEIISRLPEDFIVQGFDKKIVKNKSKQPFTTSTMQQAAFNIFNFSTKKTQSIAQKLYEGINIDGEFKGLITYMRTDSERLSEEFVTDAKKLIKEKYGDEYVGEEHVQKNKQNIQNAHEAIRPTDLSFTPEMAHKHLTKDEYSLYKLIYNRAVASLMSPRQDEITTLTLNGNNFIFEAKSFKSQFPGYSKVYGEYESYQKDSNLPSFEVGSTIHKDEIIPTQHFTKPPLRYTEGRIVKLMEDKGIGRPSTFASTISTLAERKYVEVKSGTLYPTEQGMMTVDELVQFFPPFMESNYTAKMETDLDSVVAGDSSRTKLLHNFCEEFFPLFNYARDHMEKLKDPETGGTCPVCGKPLVIKQGRYGSFIACSGWPECKYTEKEQPKVVLDEVCPVCGKQLVYRKNKKGQEFIGCSGFPKCNYIKPTETEKKELTVVKKCPECGGDLVIRKGRGKKKFLGCTNYPNCKHNEPFEEK